MTARSSGFMDARVAGLIFQSYHGITRPVCLRPAAAIEPVWPISARRSALPGPMATPGFSTTRKRRPSVTFANWATSLASFAQALPSGFDRAGMLRDIGEFEQGHPRQSPLRRRRAGNFPSTFPPGALPAARRASLATSRPSGQPSIEPAGRSGPLRRDRRKRENLYDEFS